MDPPKSNLKEISVVAVGSRVFQYDFETETWKLVSPFSRIDIYHTLASSSFRIVGVDITAENKYTAQISIHPGLVFTKQSDSFYQCAGRAPEDALMGFQFRSTTEGEIFKEKIEECLGKIGDAKKDPGGLSASQAALPPLALSASQSALPPLALSSVRAPPSLSLPAFPSPDPDLRSPKGDLGPSGGAVGHFLMMEGKKRRIAESSGKKNPNRLSGKGQRFVSPEDLEAFKRDVYAHIDAAKMEILAALKENA
eukprot:TRINITY_DN2464_c0_g1_i5.p1 TRINITY_DN2464_c0_g1~~TRINITY_DN2464_c0_g1_i5.p1  ORF type:complete len:253 (-),score=42.50 TRINITY_DN2464_c0_g1_i5:633-1391(-)